MLKVWQYGKSTIIDSMKKKPRLCFVDNLIPIENYDPEGNMMGKGFLFRVQSEAATYYASSYFYFPLPEYNKLQERLGDKKISQGQWIYAIKFRGKGYKYIDEIDCTAFRYSYIDVEPAYDIQDRKDSEISQLERNLANINEIHAEFPFPMDGHGSLIVSVLKVGQGDLILIKFPSNRGIIVDAHYSRLIHQKIHNQIRQFFGDRAPDAMLITHKHLDHIRYADEIIAKHEIGECWWGVCSRHHHSSPTSKRILNTLTGRQIRILAVNSDVDFIDNNFNLKLHYPAGVKCKYDEDQNKHSIVIDIEWKNKRIILGGDLHYDGWKDIYCNFNAFPRHIDFLKTPHHCSYTGLRGKVISDINIKYSATSCGYNKKYKHPHCEPLKSYLANSMHFMTRSTKVPSIDYTLNSKGVSRINLNTFMTAPIDCRYLECFKNCCVKCYRENINKYNSSKTVPSAFLKPTCRLKYLL